MKGDDYFNSIDEWISELELGSQIPRNSDNVKKQFLEIAQFTPLFEPYLKQPLFEELFQQLQNCPNKNDKGGLHMNSVSLNIPENMSDYLPVLIP